MEDSNNFSTIQNNTKVMTSVANTASGTEAVASTNNLSFYEDTIGSSASDLTGDLSFGTDTEETDSLTSDYLSFETESLDLFQNSKMEFKIVNSSYEIEP